MKLRGLLVYMFFSLYATFCRSSEDFNWNKPGKTLYYHFKLTNSLHPLERVTSYDLSAHFEAPPQPVELVFYIP